MLDFPVRPEKQKALYEKMERLGIKEEDIEETFIRSKGHGGQKVNKASTCVQLVHLPTGIKVRCERERSQSLNRFIAREILVRKIEELRLGEESQIRREAERIRRQKRRRFRRARQRIMEEKRHRTEIKELRRKPTED